MSTNTPKNTISKTIKLLKAILPWLITVLAVSAICHDLNWEVFFAHAREISPGWFFACLTMLLLSYPFRAIRWRSMLPNARPSFLMSYTALILGFFMNNILPARAGEFVRAHAGSRLFGTTRTEVLGTIAAERLIDGLTISLMFLLLCTNNPGEIHLTRALRYVCVLFGGAACGVILTLLFRNYIFLILQKISASQSNRQWVVYLCSRAQIFIESLAPIFSRKSAPFMIFWSVVIWGVELASYTFILKAFNLNLPLSDQVLFMVAFNFSSLIPSAPGGLGVIEAVASSALMYVSNIPKEAAVAVVLTLHILQYLVVGIPGVVALFRWKKSQKSEKISGDFTEPHTLMG